MNRNKFLVKALTSVLSASMVVGNITPVFAATTNTQEVGETEAETGTTRDVEILYEQSATYFVTIPKTITLDSSKQSGYSVKVEGDIPSDKQVYVSPVDGIADKDGFNFYMHDQSTKNPKDDVVADVTQNKLYWNFEDAANAYEATDNNVAALDLTSGTWKGTFDFEINIHKVEGADTLTLSTDGDLLMGAGKEHQVNAYLNGKVANTEVTWTSDNEEITVTEGLIETKASAQVGDKATITVVASKTENISEVAQALNNMGIITTVNADDTLTASFSVTIIDMAYTATGQDTTITYIDIKPGESKDVEVTIIPESASGTVKWSTTAPAGLNLLINGNIATLKAADDMVVGSTYDLVATYGNFSKLLKVNIVGEAAHTHNYTETITKQANCTEDGQKTYTCECGDTYTETIPATGHNYVDGTCTNCGEETVVYQDFILTNDNYMMAGISQNGVVEVPAEFEYDGVHYRTVEIGASAFKNCTNLTSITIPDSVTNIENYAFSGCTSLTSITISDNVTHIGMSAFSDCTSLEEIEIPDSVISFDGGTWDGFTFQGCSKLKTVKLPANMTHIPMSMFQDCTSLSSITIPDSVTSIDNAAFKNCTSLISITIPNNVTSIGKGNFQGGVFEGCTSLSSITIPDSVTNIGYYAFDNCTSLNNVVIPNSVTNIEAYAFRNCTSLTSIEILDGVTSIGGCAFQKCTSLKTIYIPSSITTIYASSISTVPFEHCSSTLEIYCGASEKQSGWGLYWDYRYAQSPISVTYGVTRADYEANYK